MCVPAEKCSEGPHLTAMLPDVNGRRQAATTFLQHEGTTYQHLPKSNWGLEGNDYLRVKDDGQCIDLDFKITQPGDWVRVLTSERAAILHCRRCSLSLAAEPCAVPQIFSNVATVEVDQVSGSSGAKVAELGHIPQRVGDDMPEADVDTMFWYVENEGVTLAKELEVDCLSGSCCSTYLPRGTTVASILVFYVRPENSDEKGPTWVHGRFTFSTKILGVISGE